MNWYIGQDIVAIKTAPNGAFKEGQPLIVKGLKAGFCKCTNVLIDVGVKNNHNTLRCDKCIMEINVGWTDTVFYSEKNFAPLDTLADITELTEHLNNTTPFQP